MPGPIRQSLCEAPWTLNPIGEASEVPVAIRWPVRAAVPGCVHTDLLAADLIGDPAVGLNELTVQWIGRTDWEYQCRFEADQGLLEHDRIDLACDGLDTIAIIELNGIVIGAAANMFHPHRFDARAALRNGENDLVIRFTSPLRHIRAEEARIGTRPVNGDWDAYVFIRKSACNLGWDWGPKVATCGIWKPIQLEGWSDMRLAGVRPRIVRDGLKWDVVVQADIEWAGPDLKPPHRSFMLGGVLRNRQGDEECNTSTGIR